MGLTLNALVERNEAANHNLKALGLGRRLRNAGKATIVAAASEVTVTLPVEMLDGDYYPQATLVDDAGLAASMTGSPGHVCVEVIDGASFKIKLVSVLGAAVPVAAAPAKVDVMWSVSGGRVK
jgi:hypothetical protein